MAFGWRQVMAVEAVLGAPAVPGRSNVALPICANAIGAGTDDDDQARP